MFSISQEKEILGFVIYVVEILEKMRDLLKVETSGCFRPRLKSLISFIVIWLLRKFERSWECEKKKYGFNDLCYLNLEDCLDYAKVNIRIFVFFCFGMNLLLFGC